MLTKDFTVPKSGERTHSFKRNTEDPLLSNITISSWNGDGMTYDYLYNPKNSWEDAWGDYCEPDTYVLKDEYKNKIKCTARINWSMIFVDEDGQHVPFFDNISTTINCKYVKGDIFTGWCFSGSSDTVRDANYSYWIGLRKYIDYAENITIYCKYGRTNLWYSSVIDLYPDMVRYFSPFWSKQEVTGMNYRKLKINNLSISTVFSAI